MVNTVTSSLKHYGARVLGCYDRKGIKNSEVLEFFSYLINLEWIPRALPRKVLSEALPLIVRSLVKMPLKLGASLKAPWAQSLALVNIQKAPKRA